jgi:dihydrolipoamide dehydrogenase
MSESQYDLIVIGAGPGGYVAAIRAAQLGLRTACVEKHAALGGTCLNIGCIPSKALLNSSEKFEEANHSFAAHGVELGPVKLNLKAMMARKDKVVGDLTKGVAFLFKKNKIDHVRGAGSLAGPGKVAVTPADGGAATTLQAKHILIATGSDVMTLPGVTIDEKRIVSSTGALALAGVPKHLVVVGGGVIGLELGSVWRRLGAQVTVVEFLDRVLPEMDGEVSKNFGRIMKKQGMTLRLGSKVTSAKAGKSVIKLGVEPAEGGKAETIDCDVVLVAIGRRPYTDGLGLEKAGVKTDERGFIVVDDQYRTTADGVYAIGDCVPGPMLAHKAEDEGVTCVEAIAGQKSHLNYDAIPSIVYTWPEVAAVGATEQQLKDAGIEYRAGSFPFTANSRARTNMETDGFVKIIADAKTDRVLGAHIIGPDAGTMIHEIVVAMEFGGAAEDIARSTHGHPTLSEAVKEAALAVAGRPIHI